MRQYVMKAQGSTVTVSKVGVALFNRVWPCSELRDTRPKWFEFDHEGNLVDTNVDDREDGGAALALSQDCQAFLATKELPSWAL